MLNQNVKQALEQDIPDVAAKAFETLIQGYKLLQKEVEKLENNNLFLMRRVSELERRFTFNKKFEESHA